MTSEPRTELRVELIGNAWKRRYGPFCLCERRRRVPVDGDRGFRAGPAAGDHGTAGQAEALALGASLVNEGLGGGSAVAALFRDHDPRAQVKQGADPAEYRDQGERQAY